MAQKKERLSGGKRQPQADLWEGWVKCKNPVKFEFTESQKKWIGELGQARLPEEGASLCVGGPRRDDI